MQQDKDFVFAVKPAGISTHSPDQNIIGFVEYLSKKLKTKLYVCHRLDKETSGIMLFAKSKQAAAEIYEIFEQRKVKKAYSLVSTRNDDLPDQVVAQADLVKTTFTRKKEFQNFTLWDAIPEGGKTHQIRLHAKELGITILGDKQYGGKDFPRLMLHARELSFSDWQERSPLPQVFESEELLENKVLAAYHIALDRREMLYDLFHPESNCYRLIHTETDCRLDKLRDKLWFYWFKKDLPEDQDLECIQSITERLDLSEYTIQLMQNRGVSPEAQKHFSSIKEKSWTAKENSVKYVFKKEQGSSPGLFLDQKANRKWLKENSKGKKVLNLFCYTAGFSVCAALGGAEKVTSVDTSKATLSWAKENFEVNQLNPEDYEFYAQDVREYLKYAQKKQKTFDLIICDPPSFARNKSGVFKLEKDLPELLSGILAILNLKGRILFCLNYEAWTYKNLVKKLEEILSSRAQILEAPHPDLDYEMPGEERVMKSLIIQIN